MVCLSVKMLRAHSDAKRITLEVMLGAHGGQDVRHYLSLKRDEQTVTNVE